MTSKPIYAPLPARAMVDQRLAERHLRTLLVVAAHDRLGKNGIGCWASHARLAEMIGCEYSRLSVNLKELGELGYIERRQHPLNKRLRVYRVLYTDDAAATMKQVKGNDTLPDGKEYPSDSLPDGKSDPPDSLPTGVPKPAENSQKPGVNIFPEGVNRFRRNEGRDSPEGASTCVDALPAKGKVQNVGASLAIIERHLKADNLTPEQLEHVRDWLIDLHCSLDREDPNHGWVGRLLEEYADELCTPDSEYY